MRPAHAKSSVLMIRPRHFRFNEETSADNQFQQRDRRHENVYARALGEFDAFATALQQAGIDVIRIDDRPEVDTPDSIFPNNWITTHSDGTIVLYPMCAPNRRLERRRDVIDRLQAEHGFYCERIIDYSPHENRQEFLEGTGSIIFDFFHQIAYAALSERTHSSLFKKVMKDLDMTPVIFHALDEKGKPIYHTNVMMSVGEAFVVVCLDSVKDANERSQLIQNIEKNGKEIINISFAQMNAFAGNILQLRSKRGELIVAMSSQAFHSFRPEQIKTMEKSSRIVHVPLTTIEAVGGGGARCMLAEIGLPRIA